MFLSHHYVKSRLDISAGTTVLDIGGAAGEFDHGAVTVVDIADPVWPCADFVRLDICREPLPFDTDSFDVCICTHTLEDLANPFLMLDEMQRVAKRGYFETPSRGMESSFNVSQHLGVYPGWGHHRWMFDTVGPGQFEVIAKNWYLLRHDVAKIAQWHGPSAWEFFWYGTYAYKARVEQDQHGDHWDDLSRAHNDFVAHNRANCLVLDDGEDRAVLQPAPRPAAAPAEDPPEVLSPDRTANPAAPTL